MFFTNMINKVILIFLFFGLSIQLFYGQSEVAKPYYDNVVIFKIKQEYKNSFDSNKELNKYFSKIGVGEITKEFPKSKAPDNKYNSYGQEQVDLTSIYRLNIQNDSAFYDIIKTLNSYEVIEYAEPLYKVELLHSPNDPYAASSQYWISKIKADEAWDICKGDTNVVIGISDTGIDLSHPDLIYNIKYNYNDIPDGIDNDYDGFIDNFKGWNFGSNNNNTQADVKNHGVFVSGIVGASTNNGIGVAGAGYNCKIIPLKISDPVGVLVNTYQSIVYAAEHGCDVINCSWGSRYYQRMGQDVINYAVNNYDMIVVAACGNTNTEVDYYPASYENVISVAATTNNDEKWTPENTPTTEGSSFGYNVDICAPGTMFYSTNIGSYSQVFGGTSFAAPIVSGCAGILRSYFPSYSALQICELLKITSDVIDTIQYNHPFANKLGAGRVNLFNALTMTHTPSIVFRNYTIDYYNDKVVINGNFCNFLNNAENLNITIETDSQNVVLENEFIFSGNLNTLETYISNNQIILNYNSNIDYGTKIKLVFNYNADNYVGKQIIEFILLKEYKNIKTDLLSLSITDNGRLGYADLDRFVGDGFIINNNTSLFLECGIIAGKNSDMIYSSVRQPSDFRTIEYPYDVFEQEIVDYQIKYKFDDNKDINPIGIKYIQDVYTKIGSTYDNIIFIDYTLINDNLVNINDFYFGLYTNWNLFDGTKNSANYILDKNFLYCKSDNTQTLYGGIKLLSDQNVKNYILPLISGGDGLVDITNGYSDIEKYYTISNSSNGFIDYSTDIAIYSGAGPFNIKANDSLVLSFAIIVSYDYYNFIQGLDNALQFYSQIHNSTDMTELDCSDKLLYPNPCNKFLKINLESNNKVYCYEIINVVGEVVNKSNCIDTEVINIETLTNGIYNINIHHENKIYKGKFIKID